MKPLERPDLVHLEAAQGWLGLGNHLEADKELDEIKPELRAHPDVLDVRWQIYAKAEKWEACLEIAQALVKLAPKRVSSWIHRAFSVRRAKGGGLAAAYDSLLPAVEQFPKFWLVPYNLACYTAQLGRIEEAEKWFKRAMALNEKEVKRVALDDLDLEPLWKGMGGTTWKRAS